MLVLQFKFFYFTCFIHLYAAAPHFVLNKIKRVVPPCALVVGAHVCANHNPVLIFRWVRSAFKQGEQNQRPREIWTNSERNSGRAAYIRPVGLHSPSNWPRQLPWDRIHQACTSAKGPRRLARVQAGWPRAPLVDLSPRAFAWYLFDPSSTLSFLLSFKSHPD